MALIDQLIYNLYIKFFIASHANRIRLNWSNYGPQNKYGLF